MMGGRHFSRNRKTLRCRGFGKSATLRASHQDFVKARLIARQASDGQNGAKHTVSRGADQ
jgi:hypothetical protein